MPGNPVETPSVAPPRGVRGLKYNGVKHHLGDGGRTPSWGAWIEIFWPPSAAGADNGRTPSWGAWIEILIVKRKKTVP